MNTDPDYVFDISRPPRRRHSQRATSRRNPSLFRSRTSTLFHELTALGYTGSRPTFYRDLGRYDLLRPLGEHAHLSESQQPMTVSTVIAAGSLRPLPVRVSPIAGEPLASYIGRVAASNHITVEDVLAVLPEWLGHRLAKHDDRGRRHDQPSTANALRQLALATGVTEAALAHALPAFTTAVPGTRPMGPMRTTTACRRCVAARGIHHPIPVHLPSYVQLCVRHGIWLSRSNRPQLDINICPEITTAQKHAWHLLGRLTPEQLMFAQVTGTRLVQADPTSNWRWRLHLLHTANPGLAETIAEEELTHAATYPDALAV